MANPNGFWWRLFSDAKNNPSTIRALSSFVCLNIMVVWTILCLTAQELLPIGYDNALLIFACIGAKAYQRKFEQNGDSNEKV